MSFNLNLYLTFRLKFTFKKIQRKTQIQTQDRKPAFTEPIFTEVRGPFNREFKKVKASNLIHFLNVRCFYQTQGLPWNTAYLGCEILDRRESSESYTRSIKVTYLTGKLVKGTHDGRAVGCCWGTEVRICIYSLFIWSEQQWTAIACEREHAQEQPAKVSWWNWFVTPVLDNLSPEVPFPIPCLYNIHLCVSSLILAEKMHKAWINGWRGLLNTSG